MKNVDRHAEKRKITRVNYSVKCQVEYNGTIFQGEIINFSLNGLLFSSDKSISISEQEKVVVIIDWVDAKKSMVSTIQCVVARKINHTLGLQFDVVDYDTLMLLKERLAAEIGDKINEEFINFMIGSK